MARSPYFDYQTNGRKKRERKKKKTGEGRHDGDCFFNGVERKERRKKKGGKNICRRGKIIFQYNGDGTFTDFTKKKEERERGGGIVNGFCSSFHRSLTSKNKGEHDA